MAAKMSALAALVIAFLISVTHAIPLPEDSENSVGDLSMRQTTKTTQALTVQTTSIEKPSDPLKYDIKGIEQLLKSGNMISELNKVKSVPFLGTEKKGSMIFGSTDDKLNVKLGSDSAVINIDEFLGFIKKNTPKLVPRIEEALKDKKDTQVSKPIAINIGKMADKFPLFKMPDLSGLAKPMPFGKHEKPDAPVGDKHGHFMPKFEPHKNPTHKDDKFNIPGAKPDKRPHHTGIPGFTNPAFPGSHPKHPHQPSMPHDKPKNNNTSANDLISSVLSCFPSTATVETRTGHIRMDELREGMEIRTSIGTFSRVFAFTHRDFSARTDFIHIRTQRHTLSLSPGHYLPVNGRLLAANSVRVGDTVGTMDGPAIVTSVSVMSDTGLFNPQTLDGTIVVNGMHASTFTTAISPSAARALLSPLAALFRVSGVSAIGSLLDASPCGLIAHIARHLN